MSDWQDIVALSITALCLIIVVWRIRPRHGKGCNGCSHCEH
ncbi:MAG: hypothetical protein PF961_04695 [Planctomycetota bacterium]|jgi:hypothetical protein|nr:hypothetical protein [Planctomycetota bacterium]